jgi:hypothetical protein
MRFDAAEMLSSLFSEPVADSTPPALPLVTTLLDDEKLANLFHDDPVSVQQSGGIYSPPVQPGGRSMVGRLLTTCDRCGSSDYLDFPVHGGLSLRRDCGRCNRFMGWPRWYGQTQDQRS